MEARFSSTSVGGKRAVQTLALAIAEQVEKDPTKPVPVVTLLVEHYQHKSYGKIFTPVFSIDEWMSLDAEAEAPAPAPVVEEPAPAPAGRRRRAVA